MAQLVEAGRGLDFDGIADEFHTQLPMNTGRLEWDHLTGAPQNHPVIAFERAILSLPMTLPNAFTDRIEREAGRVYAEFEVVNEIGDGTTIAELAIMPNTRSTVELDSRSDVEDIIESLNGKSLIVRDGDTIRLHEFDTES